VLEILETKDEIDSKFTIEKGHTYLYELKIKGKVRYLLIGIGTNGFILSAHPYKKTNFKLKYKISICKTNKGSKMKVFIKDYCPSTVYMGEKSHYLIVGQLDNGMIVEIFDPQNFAPEIKVNTSVECLILVFYPHFNEIDFKKGHQRDHPIITGRFIEEYVISEDWNKRIIALKNKQNRYTSDPTKEENILIKKNYKIPKEPIIYPAVQTVNGILLMYFNEEPKDLNNGDIITFTEGRLDLLSWRPIE